MKTRMFDIPSIPQVLMASLLCLMLTTGTNAEVKEDFNNLGDLRASGTTDDANVESEVIVDPSDNTNKVLMLGWSQHKGSHVTTHLTRKGATLIDIPGTYTITAKVNLEECGASCKGLALRLVDSNGEIFQFSHTVTKDERFGWQTISWTVDTQNPNAEDVSSWGGKEDGKNHIDLPLYYRGFAVSFEKWTTDGGAIYIDDITVTVDSK